MFKKATFSFSVQNKDSTLYDEIEEFINNVNKQMLKTAHNNKEHQKYIESFKVTETYRLHMDCDIVLTSNATSRNEAHEKVEAFVFESLLGLDVRLENEAVPVSDASEAEAELSIRSNTEYVLHITGVSWG